MQRQCYFKDFIPDDSLRSEMELALNRILDRAPYGAVAVALLQLEGVRYRCSVDVYSHYGPFIANFVQNTPHLAMHQAEISLLEKLNKWKETHSDARESTLSMLAPLG